MSTILHSSLTGRRLCVALLLSALGIAGTAYSDDASSFKSTAGLDGVATGAEIYQHLCQGCHMPDGKGARGAGYYPALAGDSNLAAWQYPAVTVLNGRHGMPPFGLPASEVQELRAVHLSDEQIAAVVNYVRGHFGNHYPEQVSTSQIAALPHPELAGTPP